MKKLLFILLSISASVAAQETEFTFNNERGMTDFVVTNVEGKTAPEIYKKAFIRCSTNFISWKDNQLICILHLKKLVYIRSFFFTIEDTYPYRPIKYSKIYHFFNERIEFASGIQWRNDKIVVSLGVNDYKGYVTEIDPNDIEFD